MKKQRKHYTPDDRKSPSLRRHLLDKEPISNLGERWHKSLKGECIPPGTPLSLEDARHLVNGSVEYYNNLRLNIAVGYINPKNMLAAVSGRSTPRGIGSWGDAKQRQIRRPIESTSSGTLVFWNKLLLE
jgi:hypothetical protein